MTTTEHAEPSPRVPLGRRLSTFFYRHPRASLGVLLAAPVGWLVVGYLGSLFVLLLASFWDTNPFTSEVVHDYTLDNFRRIFEQDVYREVAWRTIRMAALVTLADAVLAFPIAYYMARVASPRVRNLLVVAVVMPLWASYLVKAFAWRTILSDSGALNWALDPLGISFDGYSTAGLWLVFTYLWLPFMILPIYAGLERIPQSVLDASADLGGRSLRTFFRVILPLAFPAVVAGSIFTFSLTLGDYIAPGPDHERAVHRDGHLRPARNESARGRRLHARADHRDDPLPLGRPAAEGVRGAVGESMIESRLTRVFLRLGAAVTLAFIYVPLIVIAMYAFNESVTQSWPIENFSTKWFSVAYHNEGIRDALRLSLLAALGAPPSRSCSERSSRSQCRATDSSGARRSRSSSSCRSHCPESSRGSRSRRPTRRSGSTTGS